MKLALFVLGLVYVIVAVSQFNVPYAALGAGIIFVGWCAKDRHKWFVVGALALLALSIWVIGYWVQDRESWATVLLLVISIFLTVCSLRALAKWKLMALLPTLVCGCVLSTTILWITASSYDYWRPSHTVLSLTPKRLESRRDGWPTTGVAIALSGGGYRAAFMHAGVLDTYEQLGVKISAVSAVSGGAIVGSYYVGGGSPRGLFEGLASDAFNLKRRILQFPNVIHLAMKLELPFIGLRLNPLSNFNRTLVQAQLVDDVFLHGTTWQTLSDNHAPRLLIGTTDLIHGAALGFTSYGALHRPINSPFQSGDYSNVAMMDEEKLTSFDPGENCEINSRLSEVVAASGAFPGAFNSVDPKCHETLFNDYGRFLLADGGIADNSGLSLLIAAGNKFKEWRSDVVLVSDAGSLLPDLDDRFAGVDLIEYSSVKQALRSVDVVFSNSQSKRFAASDYNPKTVLLSPAMFVESSPNRAIYGPETIDEPKGFYVLGLEALERTGAKYGGALLSIPLERITEREFQVTNNNTLTSGNGAPIKDRATLLIEARACCTLMPGSGTPLVRNNVIVFEAKDFADCAATFLRVTTLKSDLTLEEANRVFRLGQYLAILNWDATKDLLDAFEAYRKKGRRLIVRVEQVGDAGSVGGSGQVRFEIENQAPEATRDVEFHADLPSNFAIVAASGSTKDGLCSVSGLMVSCLFGDMPARSKRSVLINLRILRYVRPQEFGAGSDGNNWVKIIGVASSSMPSRDVSVEIGKTKFLIAN